MSRWCTTMCYIGSEGPRRASWHSTKGRRANRSAGPKATCEEAAMSKRIFVALCPVVLFLLLSCTSQEVAPAPLTPEPTLNPIATPTPSPTLVPTSTVPPILTPVLAPTPTTPVPIATPTSPPTLVPTPTFLPTPVPTPTPTPLVVPTLRPTATSAPTPTATITPTPAPQAGFGDGTWLIHTDVVPGLYSAPGGDSCYWERLSG